MEDPRIEGKKSKSAKKREYLELQILGEQLIGLPESQLRAMSLEDDLETAIIEASTITSNSASRRHRQLIGKLMRQVDPEPIRMALSALTADSRDSKKNFKLAEQWRDQIAANGHASLQEFFTVTGHANDALIALVDDLDRSHTDARRRSVRRSIFRLVHDDLGTAQR